MKENKMWFEAAYQDGEFLWIAPAEYNFFYCVNCLSMKIEKVEFYPEEHFWTTRLYGDMIKCKNKLYFSPVNARGILVYDCVKGDFEHIPIRADINKDQKSNPLNFYKAYIFGQKLYFISPTYPAIVILELENHQVHYDYVTDFVKALFPQIGEKIRIRSSALCNGHILMTLKNGEAFVTYNCELGDYQLYGLKGLGNEIMTPCYDGKYYWGILYSNGKNEIFRLDPRNTHMDTYPVQTGIYKDDACISFIGSAFARGNVYFFPSRCDKAIISIDTKTLKISCRYSGAEGNRACSFSLAKETDKMIYLYEVNENTMWYFSKQDMTLRQLELKFEDASEKIYQKVLRRDYMRKKDLVHENTIYPLHEYIEMVTGIREKGIKDDSARYGDLIYEILIPG